MIQELSLGKNDAVVSNAIDVQTNHSLLTIIDVNLWRVIC